MKDTSDAVKSCQKNMSNDATPEKLLESITKAEPLENFPAELLKEARAKLRVKEEMKRKADEAAEKASSGRSKKIIKI